MLDNHSIWSVIQPGIHQTTTVLWKIASVTTEIGIESLVKTKVVLTGWRPSSGHEPTASMTAVDVKHVGFMNLPEPCCCIRASCMSTDIYVVHQQALAVSKKTHDIVVAETSPYVVSVIYVIKVIETAGCSPVCRCAAEALHSRERLSVRVPVRRLVVNWCVLCKSAASELA